MRLTIITLLLYILITTIVQGHSYLNFDDLDEKSAEVYVQQGVANIYQNYDVEDSISRLTEADEYLQPCFLEKSSPLEAEELRAFYMQKPSANDDIKFIDDSDTDDAKSGEEEEEEEEEDEEEEDEEDKEEEDDDDDDDDDNDNHHHKPPPKKDKDKGGRRGNRKGISCGFVSLTCWCVLHLTDYFQILALRVQAPPKEQQPRNALVIVLLKAVTSVPNTNLPPQMSLVTRLFQKCQKTLWVYTSTAVRM